jgi:hypothetical protein
MGTNVSDRQYPDLDPADLEPHYSLHVEAMTVEGLEAKGAIAEQLAWRDARTDALEAELAAIRCALGERQPDDTPIPERIRGMAVFIREQTLEIERLEAKVREQAEVLAAVTQALENVTLAMRLWGAEEDGIPEDGPIAAAYDNAQRLLKARDNYLRAALATQPAATPTDEPGAEGIIKWKPECTGCHGCGLKWDAARGSYRCDRCLGSGEEPSLPVRQPQPEGGDGGK